MSSISTYIFHIEMRIFVNSEINFDRFESICQKSIMIKNWSKGIDNQKMNFLSKGTNQSEILYIIIRDGGKDFFL